MRRYASHTSRSVGKNTLAALSEERSTLSVSMRTVGDATPGISVGHVIAHRHVTYTAVGMARNAIVDAAQSVGAQAAPGGRAVARVAMERASRTEAKLPSVMDITHQEESKETTHA